MSYKKDFDRWNKVKKNAHSSNTQTRFKEREIWWCRVGVNVGYEIDGKSESFMRPVLVLKKITADTFIGIPLTRKKKDVLSEKKIAHLYCILKEGVLGKNGETYCSALDLSQIRLFDVRRLVNMKYRMYGTIFEKVKSYVRNMFL